MTLGRQAPGLPHQEPNRTTQFMFKLIAKVAESKK
jgi:hypothetical protein